MRARIKRALWCRWFHRAHMPRKVQSRDFHPLSGVAGASLRMTAGPGRTFCWACENESSAYASRAARRWEAGVMAEARAREEQGQ